MRSGRSTPDRHVGLRAPQGETRATGEWGWFVCMCVCGGAGVAENARLHSSRSLPGVNMVMQSCSDAGAGAHVQLLTFQPCIMQV